MGFWFKKRSFPQLAFRASKQGASSSCLRNVQRGRSQFISTG
jgi:hypothetical protein